MKRPFATSELPRHWNTVAARLSAIPGLGQLYKGHFAEALLLMLFGLGVLIWLGALLCLCYAAGALLQALGFSVDWLAFLLNPVTFYAGFIPALLFWVWVTLDAFDEPDLRHHLPAKADQAARLNEIQRTNGHGDNFNRV